MNQELIRIVENISKDKNIDKESIFQDLEAAMISAARKHFGVQTTSEVEIVVSIDRASGAIRAFKDDEEIDIRRLGRIPAQTAKQVMIQKIKADERDSIYAQYVQRKGEIASGTVARFEGGSLIVSLENRIEAVMPRAEQITGESIDVKSLAREAGYRTKVAVETLDDKVDPVGACVGVRGSRIRNIVDELGGEKIDIVRWSDSSQVLIANALMPAKVSEIAICFELGRATVVVTEDQLSLAIGKHGQNVRLAARLTGWDIDILTPPEYNKEVDRLAGCIRQVEGVEESFVDKLLALGIISVLDLEEVGTGPLVEELEIEAALAQKIIVAAEEAAKAATAEENPTQAEGMIKQDKK
ncbi:MAG: transcription termination/antitermination protein NusA [Planctomycetota bacterium]|jgi:N utilization substance protein A